MLNKVNPNRPIVARGTNIASLIGAETALISGFMIDCNNFILSY